MVNFKVCFKVISPSLFHLFESLPKGTLLNAHFHRVGVAQLNLCAAVGIEVVAPHLLLLAHITLKFGQHPRLDVFKGSRVLLLDWLHGVGGNLQGVYGLAIFVDTEVEVRTRGVTGATHIADFLALRHTLTHVDTLGVAAEV